LDERKAVSGILLTLLLISILTPVFNIQPVIAELTTIIVPNDYPTIQEAVNAASPGDTIIVREGTYTENVKVSKDHLTIKSENGAEVSIVQAANSNDHVFEVTADYVNMSGFTVKGATEGYKVGIYLYQVKYCSLLDCKVSNNYYGIHLYRSTNNNIIDSTLNSNNIYGIYLEFSGNNNIMNNNVSNNHIAIGLTYAGNNVIKNNTANSNISGYGIWLYSSDSNAIMNNNVSNNGVGIDLHYSRNNNITHNIVNSNELIGIWLDWEGSSNSLTKNTVKSNNQYGILCYSSYNVLYLNNIANNGRNVYYRFELTNTWNSPEEINYTYNSKAYENYIGNYWSDYTGSDVNNDGIGDTPYSIDGDMDNYPVMEPFENYLPPPISEQPQLKAPWEGVAEITQGNYGATSHYDHGTWDNTYAIDVALSVGSDVLAPADGVAVYVDDDSSGPGGKELAVEHTGPTGKEFVTVYLHLDEIFVGEGDSVRQGQVIAKSGDTGDVTGPHLHFHIWRPKGSLPEWRYDSHTMPIDRLVLKQVGVDSDFREYDARKGELDDDKIAEKLFESNNIRVALNQPPVAMAGTDQWVSSGDLVFFDGSNSYDSDGTIVSYEWDFQDGETDTGCHVSHRFRGAAIDPETHQLRTKTYTVKLTVKDNKGAIATDTAFVTVKPLRKLVDVSPGYSGVSCWMEATYNWVGTDEAIGENFYIISRIDSFSGGIAGAYQLFILLRVSPPPSIPKLIWHIPLLALPVLKTYFTPFTPSIWQELWGTPAEPIKLTFPDGTFEGIGVTDTSLMVIVATGTEVFPLLYYDAGITKFDPDSPVVHLKLEELKELYELKDIIDLLNKIIGVIHSPGELRIYDSEGRITGTVNGEVKEEIPGSIYVDGTVVILYPSDFYRYEVVGTETGTYGVDISFIKDGEATTFTSTDIPISTNAIHQYTIDWCALSLDEEGVTLEIDIDGDGTFEQTVTADSDLTYGEFMLQMSPQGLKLYVIEVLKAAFTEEKKVDHKLDKAIDHIEKSLDPDLWLDGDYLDSKHGHKVFDEEKKAVKELMHLIDKDDMPEESKEICLNVIEKLVEADKKLANTIYDEAKAYAGDPKVDKELEKCDKEFEKAQKELEHLKKDGTLDPKYDKAIDHYKKVWEHAQKALKHAT